MLKQRVLTAIILALVFVLSILFGNNAWVAGLFALMLYAATQELFGLTVQPGSILGALIALAFAALFWFATSEIAVTTIYYQALAGLLLWSGILVYLYFYRFSGDWACPMRLFHCLLGFLLLWICAQSLVFIHRYFDQGSWMLLYLLTLVWIADIGAYFSGRQFGRHKLAPGISPNKTWEGVVGGIVSNLAWMCIVFWLSAGWGMSLWQFLLVGLATSCISVVGDLYESILKREAAVKDSGKILPGHGGVLDRIDSVIAAAPVFLSGLYLVGAG